MGIPAIHAAPAHSHALYEGRTLEQWRDAIKSLDPRSNEAAAAVPGLLAIAKDPHAPWFSRRQAALTLGRIGPQSASAVPEITALIQRPPTDEDPTTSIWAVQALALWGPVAAPATPVLIELVSHPATDSHLRLVAVEALGRIGTADIRSLPAIVRQLQWHPPHRDGSTTRSGQELDLVSACIECLDLYGGEAIAAVPVLLRFSEDREERIRRAVAVTLGRIGLRAEQAAPRLAELILADRSEDVRDVAAISLGQVGGTELLSRLLSHPQATTRERAATGLGWAPADETSRNALQIGRNDVEPRVRMAAIEATQKRFPDTVLTAPLAAREMAAEDRHVRIRAVRFLTLLGRQAHPAEQALQSLTNHPHPHVRQSAQRLLDGLSSDPPTNPALQNSPGKAVPDRPERQ